MAASQALKGMQYSLWIVSLKKRQNALKIFQTELYALQFWVPKTQENSVVKQVLEHFLNDAWIKK